MPSARVHFAADNRGQSDGRWVLQDVTLEVEQERSSASSAQRIWKTSLLKLLQNWLCRRTGRSHCSAGR